MSGLLRRRDSAIIPTSGAQKGPAQIVINALPQFALVQIDTASGNTYTLSIIDGLRGEVAIRNARLGKLSHGFVGSTYGDEGQEITHDADQQPARIIEAGCELCLKYDDCETTQQEMTTVTDVFRMADSPEGERMVADLERQIETASVRDKAKFIEDGANVLQDECESVECAEAMHQLIRSLSFPDEQVRIVIFLEEARQYGILSPVVWSLKAKSEMFLHAQQQVIASNRQTGRIWALPNAPSWSGVPLRPLQGATVVGPEPAFRG